MNSFAARVGRAHVLALIMLLGVCSRPVVAGTIYQVTDLGDIGGGYTTAYGLNNNGDVVGQSRVTNDPNSAEHAFLYSNGQITDIHQLGTFNSVGIAINNQGQVTGRYDNGGESSFFYANGTMHDIGSLGGVNTYAEAINGSGTVVGYGQDAFGNYRAFTYANGMIKDLGILTGQQTGAFAINNSGTIAGLTFGAGGQAWVYSNNQVTYITKTGYSFTPSAIDAAGDVVGSGVDQHQNIRGFIYSASTGQVTVLGTLAGGSGFQSSSAAAINDLGQVVGSTTGKSGGQEAFLYQNGTMYDLNNLIIPGNGVYLEGAVGINDNGQIIANGFDDNGATRAFLLTPLSVPEPSTLTLGAISSLVGLVVWGRCSRRVRVSV
jgi:probable HAF family extracellular repeat protein